jgi:hypothetical protein
MLAWIYQVASRQNPALEPSFLIGGVAENFGTSFHLRPTRTFIIEGDEYDTAFFDKGPKFLHYFPDVLILTHVEFDHADIYADLEAVKVAFKRLVNLVPRRGLIVAYDGSANVTECVGHAFCKVERYGFTSDAAWQLRNLRHEDNRTRWQLWHDGALWSELEMHWQASTTHSTPLLPPRLPRVKASRKKQSSQPSPASRASSAVSKFAPKSAASPSSTISRTTQPPFAKPCARCAPSIRILAFGQSSNRAPIRSAAKSSRAI